jgi:anti-sigma B factor antagonist
LGEGISGRPKLFIAPSGRRPGEVWLPVIDREWPDVRGGDEPRGFNVRPSVQAGEVIVEVVGELDLATAPLLDEVLLGAGAVATGRVVVDVSHLTFMGAAGLSVLVGAHYRLLGERREGLVVRGASGIVRRVVEVTALSFLLEDPDAAGAAGAVPCQGFGCHNLEVGRRVAGLSVTDLFVAYFALGGTAHLGEVRAFLGGVDDALAGHQQDVAVHAVNERLVELGHRDRLLSYASD